MKDSKIIRTQNILLLCLLLILAESTAYSYSSCNTTGFLNTANLQCKPCQNNQISNSYQTIPIACQCAPGYSLATNGAACTAAFSTTCSISNSYYPIYGRTGTVNTGTANCVACSSDAYSNTNGTGCNPCGPGMTYSNTQGCVCSSNTNIKTQLGCFQSSITPSVTSSVYSEQLKYLIPACATYNDYLSCSQIINLCVYSQAKSTTPQCQFFATYSLSSMLESTLSSFSLTASQSLELPLKLISFSSTGNYLGQKFLVLNDIMRCGTPSDSELGITFGTNIQVSCSFDFNNLIIQMQSKQYQGNLYQMLLQGDDQNYYDVPVYMSGSSVPVRRFFLQDSYTYPNKLNVLSSFTFSFIFSDGKITSPKFTPTYTLLSTQLGTGVVGDSSLTLSFNIFFNSDLSNYWKGAIASFVVISILALVHTIAKTYIGYLNRKSALLFFYNFAGIYSLWLFYYLLFMTGYWFLFTKVTSSPFLLLPPSDMTLYSAFYALVAVMFVLRTLWALKDKADKLSIQVHMINWQQNQPRNSWRQIFIINSLAEFYTYRTFSIFWMMAVLLFFMTGLKWQSLSSSTSSTSQSYSTLTPQNRLLLYFLAAASFIAIGIVFKLLRRLSVLYWPYPFQNFVDYCTVTNISFVFIKRRSPHAYYIHATMGNRTDGTYRQLNDSIRKGLTKNNRSIGNQIATLNDIKLYSMYLSKDIEEKHTLMLKKIQEQEYDTRVKYGKENQQQKGKINHREEFTEKKLKPEIQKSAFRGPKQLIQSYCGTPPIDLRTAQEGRRTLTNSFQDNNLQLVNQVFPNGNEFQEIHTIIVIFLGLVTLINSCPIAAFLTYFIDQYLICGWISESCRNNLEKMTRVNQAFML